MKNKFQILQPWVPYILSSIKKYIKVEHLAKMPSFYRVHFGSRPLNRVTNEEMIALYEKELIQSNNEDLNEWIVNRWVFHHSEIYQYFSEALSRIHHDFSAIKNLDENQSRQIVDGSLKFFGALNTYLFSVLNEVVFTENILTELRDQAEKEEALSQAVSLEEAKKRSMEEMKSKYEEEMLRLQKKCEDKVLGAIKKHATDVEALKKQIRALQQQLNAR